MGGLEPPEWTAVSISARGCTSGSFLVNDRAHETARATPRWHP